MDLIGGEQGGGEQLFWSQLVVYIHHFNLILPINSMQCHFKSFFFFFAVFMQLRYSRQLLNFNSQLATTPSSHLLCAVMQTLMKLCTYPIFQLYFSYQYQSAKL